MSKDKRQPPPPPQPPSRAYEEAKRRLRAEQALYDEEQRLMSQPDNDEPLRQLMCRVGRA